jgi:hypothetical protein
MRAGSRGISGPALGLLLAWGLALPVAAQDDEVQVVPAGEEYGEPAVEEYAAEEVPSDADPEAQAEEPLEEVAAAEPAEPLALYVGADWVSSTLSRSSGGGDFDSGMWRARVGMRALESVGVEAHIGVDNSDGGAGSVETDGYYGVFLVPTATVFETVELAFPVGYAQSTFGARDYRSVAYGLDAELPLRTFFEGLPDLRLTAGWMVYYQKTDARAYGANAGLRWDFQSAGNPFAGLGGRLAGLWPFGGGGDAAE